MNGTRSRAMSERRGRMLLNLYPPLFFQRIRCLEIGPGFLSCKMRVSKSLLNRNLNGTIFGGTIFAAADPVYSFLYWQIFARRGMPVQAWLAAAGVRYLQPAASDLTLDFAIPEAHIQEAIAAFEGDGRYRRTYTTPAIDVEGEVCALIETEAYLRLHTKKIETQLSRTKQSNERSGE